MASAESYEATSGLLSYTRPTHQTPTPRQMETQCRKYPSRPPSLSFSTFTFNFFICIWGKIFSNCGRVRNTLCSTLIYLMFCRDMCVLLSYIAFYISFDECLSLCLPFFLKNLQIYFTHQNIFLHSATSCMYLNVVVLRKIWISVWSILMTCILLAIKITWMCG